MLALWILVAVNVLSLAAFAAVVYLLHQAQEAERTRHYEERDDARRQVLLIVEDARKERLALLEQFAAERRMLLDRAIETWEIVVARASSPEVETVTPTSVPSDGSPSIPVDDDEAYWEQRNAEGGS